MLQKKPLLIIGLLLSVAMGYGQKHDNNWLWGFSINLQDSVNLRRGNSQAQFIGNSFVITDTPRKMIFDYTNHAFSNTNGELLFYTNGMRVKNNSAATIINGDSLNYGAYWDYCYTQEQQGYVSYNIPYSHFALPSPDNDTIFYLFHQRADTLPPVWQGSMCYSIVKKHNDGSLEITEKNETLSIKRPTYGGVNACRHANGRDWWIFFMEVETNCTHKYLLTPDSLRFISTQCSGTIYDWTDVVKAYFSMDGTCFIKTGTSHGTDIFLFDRCDGSLDFSKHLNPLFEIDTTTGNQVDFILGSEISPNNKYLYLCMSRYVFQYDLTAIDVEGSIDTVAAVDYFTDTLPWTGGKYYFNLTQLGPDGKIYIGPKGGCRFMSTIGYPDSGGVACHVGVRSVVLTKLNSFSLQFNPNYRLGRSIGSACDTVYSDVKPLYKETPWLKVYPNPATDEVRVDYNWVEWERILDCRLQILDLKGMVMYEQVVPRYSTRQDVSVKQLPQGIYTVTLQDGAKKIAVCKLTVVR